MRSQTTPWPTAEAVPHSRRGVYLKTLFLSTASIAFVLGGLYFGLIFLRNLSIVLGTVSPTGAIPRVESRSPIRLPSIQLPGLAPQTAGPAQTADQRDRVTILLLGVDRRSGEANEPTRTDTMLLATYDPRTKMAGMLSIPRDLWVPIPVRSGEIIEDRINTAHLYGDLYSYPGGGPALAKATVEYNLGVKIDYFARIDFEGFEKMVDTVGGITVDVPVPLKDDAYPTPNYGTERIYFPAGLQHLDGERALKYARTRHADSDIGRTRRQQQVLLAFREQALRLNLLPQAPSLIQQLGNSLATDVSVPEMIDLALLVQEFEASNVTSRTLVPPVVTSVTTQMGADILLPNRPEIAKLMREMFFDGRLRQEAATVEVVDVAGDPALAGQAVQALQRLGITASVTTPTPGAGQGTRTEVITLSGKQYTAGVIAELFKIDRGARRDQQESGEGRPDIRLIVGRDIVLPPPQD
ncbi:MAG TPA: LCP family protein [Dehalococcoidia bacterium]|nr:LCP family protein [Dehalococcoidia bacterium]